MIQKGTTKPITKEQAEQMLLSHIDNDEFGDRIYELVQDLCNKAVQDIESKYIIIDGDGIPYSDEDDIMWYDECRNEFMKAVFEKVKIGQF